MNPVTSLGKIELNREEPKPLYKLYHSLANLTERIAQAGGRLSELNDELINQGPAERPPIPERETINKGIIPKMTGELDQALMRMHILESEIEILTKIL